MDVLPVTLRELTAETMRAVCALEVAAHQRGFVAPNAYSIAQAYFEPKAWFRGVYAGDEPVGFLMVARDDDGGRPYLWRFMIAADRQGQGLGRRALELLVDEVRTWPGATELRLSYVRGEGSPRGFYERLGFAETGEIDDGEHVMVRALVEPT